MTDTDLQQRWFEERLHELMTNRGELVEALSDGQCIELLDVLLTRIMEPDPQVRMIKGAMEQYLDYVVYQEQQRGAFEQWLRDQDANAADLKNDAEWEKQ